MADEDSPNNVLRRLGSTSNAEPKSKLPTIVSPDKPFSTPSTPASETEFVKGYKEGYDDGKNKKQRRF